MYGWRIFQAIEKHCKVPEHQGGGYVSIRNVDRVEGEKGWVDNMETFFLVSYRSENSEWGNDGPDGVFRSGGNSEVPVPAIFGKRCHPTAK